MLYINELNTEKRNSSYSINWSQTIKLNEGEKKYIIQSSESREDDFIEIGINYATDQTYAQSGRLKDPDIELFHSNTPIGNYDLYSLNQWQQNSQYTTSEEINIAKKILSDSIKIHRNDNSIIKIQKIASYVLKNLDNHRGIPIDSMDIISPIEQLKFVEHKKSKVWCGNFSKIFSFLANNADVLTRAVDLGGNIEGVLKPKPKHSFNEVFIKELNKWVFIDLTSKTLFVKSSSGEFLNTIDFYNSHMLKSDNLTIVTFEQNSIKEIEYEKIRPFYEYYFSQNSYFMFYLKNQFTNSSYDFSSKIKRYLTKSPTFTSYSRSKTTDNKKFYLKQFLLLTLLIFSVYWLTCLLVIYYSKRRTLHNTK